MDYELHSTAANAPTVAPWQHGWDIPVNITEVTHPATDLMPAYTAWEYDRVVVPALTVDAITTVVDADYASDPDVLAQALSAAGLP